jgi:hypothetical protein
MFNKVAKQNRSGWKGFAWLIRVVLAPMLLACCPAGATQNVSLAWDASPDPDVVGYYIYYGAASGDFTNRVSVGNVTSATVSNLAEGALYFFAATARNTSGLESDFSNEVSYSVPMAPVNRAPFFDPIDDVTVLEDPGATTVLLTGISPGSTNEIQTLSITARSSNPALIPDPKALYSQRSSSGSLSFQPAANMSGTATITVTIDDGQPVNNRTSRSFDVTVTPVNDRPYLPPIPNVNLVQGTAAQTIELTGIHSGAANEWQKLSITAASSNPSLIPAPAITYSSPSSMAALVLTPATGKSGRAEIIVTLTDGQSENSIFCRTFQVVVTGSNSPPAISPIAYQSTHAGRSLPPVPFFIQDKETAASELKVTVSCNNTSLLPASGITLGGAGSERYLALSPAPAQRGKATVIVFVSDGTLSSASSFDLIVSEPLKTAGNETVATEGQSAAKASGQSGNQTFTGLFFETNKVRQASSGYFTLSTSKKGKYSGYAQVGLRRYSFTGVLDSESRGTNYVKRGALSLSFQILADGRISGEILSSGWIATLDGTKTSSSSAQPRAMTLVIPGGNGEIGPAGHGYATLQIRKQGQITLFSELADGTRSVSSLRMGANQSVAWYAPLYAGKGSLMSWLQITNNEITGLVNWIKPGTTRTRLYPEGFECQSQASGSVFFKTNTAADLMQATTGSLTFTGPGLALTNQVSLSKQISNLGPAKMSVSLNRNNGVFKGVVFIPDQPKPQSFRGVILLNKLMGFGFLPFGDQTVPVTFEPARQFDR